MHCRMSLTRLVIAVAASLPGSLAMAQVERVWLTYQSADPGKIVVNWTSAMPGDAVVHFGPTADYGQRVRVAEQTTLHHVEIPAPEPGGTCHYRVSTGDQTSSDTRFQACPAEELRVAVVADWQGKPDLSAILKDDVHLLLTAGDNVASIHGRCGAGNKDCIKPYADLIDAYPELFRSVPLMPVLGNHDKEIRPRGKKPPAQPVYDIDATAFRRFFALPGDEWKWQFDIPRFGIRFVALDLNHLSDFGTTWQSCHPSGRESEQFAWYRKVVADADQPFVVTLYNEKNSTVRQLERGAWGDMIRQGTLAVTGFGYFAERAEVEGFQYYNTSLSGRGDRYPDPRSKFLKSADSYLLLTIRRTPPRMTAELKSLDGTVLDRQEYGPRRAKHEE